MLLARLVFERDLHFLQVASEFLHRIPQFELFLLKLQHAVTSSLKALSKFRNGAVRVHRLDEWARSEVSAVP